MNEPKPQQEQQNLEDALVSTQVSLQPKQSIAFKYLTDPKYNHIKHVGYGGAAGSGKTILGAIWLVYSALTHPNTRWAICREEEKNLQNTSMKSIDMVLGEEFFNLKKGIDYEFNVKRKTYTFLNTDSEIIGIGLRYEPSDEECTWLGGWELTGAFIDESNEVASKVIEVFITRVGRRGNTKWVPASEMTDKEKEENPKWNKDLDKKKWGYQKRTIPSKILQCFNPSQNHVYSRFWLPYKKKKQLPDTRFVRAFVEDNPRVGDEYIETLHAMPEGVLKERLLRGSFDYATSDDVLCKSEELAWSMVNKLENQQGKYMIIDVSASGADIDKTIIGFFKGFDMYDVVEIEHESPEELIREILRLKSQEGISNSQICIDANGVGNQIARSEHLKGCVPFIAHNAPVLKEVDNMLVRKKNKHKMKSSMVRNYNRLRDQCIFMLAEKINGRSFTFSFENETLKDNLKQELLLYKNESSGTDKPLQATSKKDLRVKIGRSTDVSDLPVMRMLFELIKSDVSHAKPISKRKFIKKTNKIKPTYV